MRWMLALGLVGWTGCFGSRPEDNPDYPPPIFPRPSLTVTEGDLVTFALGLEGGPMPDATGAFFVGPELCPTQLKLRFAPCDFRFLPPPAEYPIEVAAIAAPDADHDNERIGVSVYLFGEIAESDHGLTVYIVDTDAPNVVASNWNVTLAPAGTAYLNVRLTQPPTEPVTVTPMLAGGVADLQFAPASVTFDASNFDAYQSVTVTGVLHDPFVQVALVSSSGMSWGSVQIGAPFSDGR